MSENQRTFTLESLAAYNGKDGRRAYIAYQGKVYDVTDSVFWFNGDHQNEHSAGANLTEKMPNAPHGEEVFKEVKLIGILKS